ncbi:hypothetical protein K432DRAFT_424482 [Lepidopterella palustris CBS 459.81]|uniref:Zinc finger PHD-type domain-containing protein n=1 Tax=Lepidopterella palustris CBS 459.81 TaxID=1314670 RepID=A0A8E2EE15_9PEZI|nr:hypothetical protein K432DRAFT_424482 [Lepidopterella palustris CBS 459.81]
MDRRKSRQHLRMASQLLPDGPSSPYQADDENDKEARDDLPMEGCWQHKQPSVFPRAADDVFGISTHIQGEETDSDDSDGFLVGVDGKRHIDTTGHADEVYLINADKPGSKTVCFRYGYHPYTAIFFMRSFLLQYLPAQAHPGYDSLGVDETQDLELATLQARLWRDVAVARRLQNCSTQRELSSFYVRDEDLVMANTIRFITRELASNSLFILRSPPDGVCSCDHPFCWRVRAVHAEPRGSESTKQYLSIEPFISWEGLEPVTDIRIADNQILAYEPRKLDEFGYNDRQKVTPPIQTKFCIHCLEDLWSRRHTAGYTPFTAPKQVKKDRSSTHSVKAGSLVQTTTSPNRRKIPHPNITRSQGRLMRREDSSNGLSSTVTPLKAENFKTTLSETPQLLIMNLDGANNGGEATAALSIPNSADFSEADDEYSNSEIASIALPGPEELPPPNRVLKWNPVNGDSFTDISLEYSIPDHLKFTDVIDNTNDDYPPPPEHKPRVALRGGTRRNEIRKSGERAGIMISDLQKEYLEEAEVSSSTNARRVSLQSMPYPPTSPALSQSASPNSSRRRSARSFSAGNAVKTAMQTLPRRKASMEVKVEGVEDEEAKLRTAITVRMRRDRETRIVERALEEEVRKKRTENERARRQKKRREEDENEAVLLEEAMDPLDKYLLNELAPTIRIQETSTTTGAAKEPIPKLWCLCRKPDDGSTMVQCSSLDCAGVWYHYACLGAAEKKASAWFCPVCKLLEASKFKPNLDTTTQTPIQFSTPFNAYEIKDALGCPGFIFRERMRNPYGLAWGVESRDEDEKVEPVSKRKKLASTS